MSKKISKALLMARLIARFGLLRAIDEPFELAETVSPVTILDDLARAVYVGNATVNISAGAATAFTVPDGKRWRLHVFQKPATSGTTVAIYVNDPVSGRDVTIVAAGGAAVTQHLYGVPCDRGWLIRVSQGAGGDTSVGVQLLYEEEDAY